MAIINDVSFEGSKGPNPGKAISTWVKFRFSKLRLLFFAEGTKGKGKKSASSGKPVETGTSNDVVDFEWIPRSALRTPGSGKTR